MAGWGKLGKGWGQADAGWGLSGITLPGLFSKMLSNSFGAPGALGVSAQAYPLRAIANPTLQGIGQKADSAGGRALASPGATTGLSYDVAQAMSVLQDAQTRPDLTARLNQILRLVGMNEIKPSQSKIIPAVLGVEASVLGAFRSALPGALALLRVKMGAISQIGHSGAQIGEYRGSGAAGTRGLVLQALAQQGRAGALGLGRQRQMRVHDLQWRSLATASQRADDRHGLVAQGFTATSSREITRVLQGMTGALAAHSRTLGRAIEAEGIRGMALARAKTLANMPTLTGMIGEGQTVAAVEGRIALRANLAEQLSVLALSQDRSLAGPSLNIGEMRTISISPSQSLARKAETISALIQSAALYQPGTASDSIARLSVASGIYGQLADLMGLLFPGRLVVIGHTEAVRWFITRAGLILPQDAALVFPADATDFTWQSDTVLVFPAND